MIDALATEVSRITSAQIDKDRYLIINNKYGKRAVFLYAGGARKPSFIVRMAREEFGIKQCEREFNNLKGLETLNLNKIEFPHPVQEFSVGGRACFLQTAVYASSLMSMIPLSRFGRLKQRDFYWITEALVCLYRTSRTEVAANGEPGVRCFQHGDFWVGNLGRKDDSLLLYDLEFGNPKGWPLQDLLHFGLIARVVMNNVGKMKLGITRGSDKGLSDNRTIEPDADAVCGAFLGSSPLARTMRECIRRYLAACNIARDDAIRLAWSYFKDDRQIVFSDPDCVERIFK